MSTGQAFQQMPMQQMMPMQQQMPNMMPMPMQMVPQSSSYFDLIIQYKWVIIAIIAAIVYMRYFNKKPKEEEKKA
jgi:hypothetical protein